VRRLCAACRQAEPLDGRALATLAHLYLASSGRPDDGAGALVEGWRARHGDGQGRLRAYKRVGCPRCEGSGYHGRLGLHELLVADDALRERIRHRASAAELQAAGLATGLVTLRQDGIEKVLAGDTDLAEVVAATNQ
jgi:type II secretory ATPase GspE/PulE/Tfp pilus assembly ATPase PilB-like protein